MNTSNRSEQTASIHMREFYSLVLSLAIVVVWTSGCYDSVSVQTQVVVDSESRTFDKTFADIQSSGATEFICSHVLGANDLTRLTAIHDLEVIELHDVEVKPGTLANCLKAWPALKRLRIDGCEINDDVMKAIGRLEHLEVLNLPNGDFSDDGLAYIASLPNLFLLRFGSSRVTDAGLSSLANAPALRFLHLLSVPITDDGLQAFQGMKQLESFYIDGGRETEHGIRALLAANPRLHFHRNQLHIAEDANADGH